MEENLKLAEAAKGDAEKKASATEDKLKETSEKLANEGNRAIVEFLHSSALVQVAFLITGVSMKNGLYGLAERLAEFYPFTPEELDLEVGGEEDFDFSGYKYAYFNFQIMAPQICLC